MKPSYLIFLVIIFIALVLGCTSAEQTVKSGDTVAVEYNLTIDNGTLIDTTVNKTPFTFVVGSEGVIKGFSYGVIGMKSNETKTITIVPEEAYGEHYDSLVRTIQMNNTNFTIGQEITSLVTKEKGIITFVNSTHVTADFNHPLAGKTLYFEVKVVNITKTEDFFNP